MGFLNNRIAQAQGNNRQDGYTNDSAVFAFQAHCERQPNCDYAKLRAVLQAARNQNYSFEQLCSMYNS